MRGTRYGDFSRWASQRGNDYRAVLMQQGRVQLDADWNEQVALSERALRIALSDALGGLCPSCGAPLGAAGPADSALELCAHAA